MIENEHGEVQLWEKPIARVSIEAQNYEENKTPHHQCLEMVIGSGKKTSQPRMDLHLLWIFIWQCDKMDNKQ